MASLKRKAENDGTKGPRKKIQLVSEVFPEAYANCRNSDMLALHQETELPDNVQGGHIVASVVNVVKHYDRGCVRLVLKLRPTEEVLECELMNAKALEASSLPAIKDSVSIALTKATVCFNDDPDQLSFKLRFKMALIYIVPPSGDSRTLKLVEIKDIAPKILPAPSKSNAMNAAMNLGPSVSKPIPTKCVDAGAARVRKTDTRLKSREEFPSGSNYALHKAARMAKKPAPDNAGAPTRVTMSRVEAEGDLSEPRGELVPILENTAVAEQPSHGQHPNDIPEPPLVPSEGSPTGMVPDGELDPAGFLSSTGIQFLALADVQALPKRANFNVVGVVEAVEEPKVTAKKEFSQVFRLSDKTCPEPWYKVILFQPRKEWLPNVHTGQIILLYGLTCDYWQGSSSGTGSSMRIKWIAFDPPTEQTFFSHNDPKAPRYQFLDQSAKDYFAMLARWKMSIQNDPNRVIIAPPEQKHKLLSELSRTHQFFNATVEVLAVRNQQETIHVFITDYTRNNLFDEPRDAQWVQLRWKRTMRLEFWQEEQNAYRAAEVLRAGKFYQLKNLLFMQTGFGWVGKVSRLDNAEFVQIRNDADDPHLKRLLQRKAAFIHDQEDDDVDVTEIPSDVFLGNPNEIHCNTIPQGEPVRVEAPLSGHKIICNLKGRDTAFRFIDNDLQSHCEYKIRGRIVGIMPFHPQGIVWVRCTHCLRHLVTITDDQRLCPGCNSDCHLELQIGFRLLISDENNECLTVIVSDNEAKHLFGIPPAGTDVKAVFDDIVNKLRNVVGDLWEDGPRFESSLKDRSALIELDIEKDNEALRRDAERKNKSPWIDLAIRSWHLQDSDASRWVRKYSLFECTFQL